jgi:hypothetical protein
MDLVDAPNDQLTPDQHKRRLAQECVGACIFALTEQLSELGFSVSVFVFPVLG